MLDVQTEKEMVSGTPRLEIQGLSFLNRLLNQQTSVLEQINRLTSQHTASVISRFYGAQGAAISQHSGVVETCLRFDTAKLLRSRQISSETLFRPFGKLQAFLGGTANDRYPVSYTRQRLAVPSDL